MRTGTIQTTVATAALLALFATEAPAQGLSGLTIKGFVSQSYVKTSDYVWLSAPTDEGTWAFTEAALTVNYEPIPNLRVGMQLLSRDIGEQGNFAVKVDWAMADYRWKDWLGVRVGKVKRLTGLYNEARDADMARTEVFLPQGLYSEAQRELVNAFQGFSLYGNVGLGGSGNLDYEVQTGTTDLDDSYYLRRVNADGALLGLEALSRMGLSQAAYSVANVKGNQKSYIAGLLGWTSPAESFRFRITGAGGDATIDGDTTYTGYFGPNPASIAIHTATSFDQEYFYTVSAEYQNGPFRFTAEHFGQKNVVTSVTTGLPFPAGPATPMVTRPLGCYGKVNYQFTDSFQAAALYSFFYLNYDDKEGATYTVRGQPAYRGWLKEYALALRYDLSKWWLVKLEYIYNDGTASLATSENPGGFPEQNWSTFAVRTTIHF